VILRPPCRTCPSHLAGCQATGDWRREQASTAAVAFEVRIPIYPFERFTERAKKVLTLAQEEADRSHHSESATASSSAIPSRPTDCGKAECSEPYLFRSALQQVVDILLDVVEGGLLLEVPR
jgi:hypothetical protein